MNVLVVDDQQEIREELSRFFSDTKALNRYHVYMADNCCMAMELLAKQKIDILLLDIVLEGNDGFSLLEAVRDRGYSINVIMMTSYLEMNYALKAIEMHVDGFLTKPFSAEKLQEVILEIEEKNKADLQSFNDRNYLYCQMLNSYLTGEHPELDFRNLCMKTGISQFDETECIVVLIRISVTDNLESKQKSFFSSVDDLFDHTLCYAPFLGEIVIIAGVMDSDGFISKLDELLRKCFLHFTAAGCVRPKEFGLQSIYRSASHILNHIGEKTDSVVMMNLFELRRSFVHQMEDDLFSARNNKEKLNTLLGILFDQCQGCHIPLQGIETDLFDCGLCRKEHFEQAWIPAIRLRAMLIESIYVDSDSTSSAKVDVMLRYMKQNYQKDISLATVANAADINYTYASMLFKQHLHKNFTEILLEIRMKEARKMVCQTNCYIYEIADKVGIHNQKYFIKQFTAAFGMPPQTYRNHVKDADQ